jgi:hypothetical protein
MKETLCAVGGGIFICIAWEGQAQYNMAPNLSIESFWDGILEKQTSVDTRRVYFGRR